MVKDFIEESGDYFDSSSYKEVIFAYGNFGFHEGKESILRKGREDETSFFFSKNLDK